MTTCLDLTTPQSFSCGEYRYRPLLLCDMIVADWTVSTVYLMSLVCYEQGPETPWLVERLALWSTSD